MAKLNTDAENPLIASFFDPTGTTGMTYEQLKARRAIAAALAAKSRDYPNTIGKGIFSLGESIGSVISDRRLDAEEARLRKRTAEEQEKNLERRAPPDPALSVPPVGPSAGGAVSPTAAALDPEVDLSRSQIADALASGVAGSRRADAPIQMASLPSTSTMSDAGAPGATYGGPEPAGPGASMAEPPDQNPPAPPAPPAVASAGPGPVGTPAPMPATGGGVPPGPMPPQGGPPPGPMPPQGGLPPGVDASRSMLADAVAANQAFNPDQAAGGPGGPGAGIPPTMLAQVGGFQGDPVSAAPSVPPRTPPVGIQRGPDGRPIIPPDMQMPTFQEWARTSGYVPRPPKSWRPDEEAEWLRLDKETRRPDLLPEYGKRAEARREQLENKVKSRYLLEKSEFEREDARQRGLFDKFGEEMRKRADPEDQYRRETASLNQHFLSKVGKPYAEVIKEGEENKKNAQTIIEDQEDKMLALDALENGVIVGKWGNFRLNVAKAGAWLMNNKVLGDRAINTETMMAKLAKGVGVAVKDLRPVSEFEVKMGKDIAGANIELETGSIKNIVMDGVRKNNRALREADTKAHQYFAGEGPLAKTYETPRVDWIDPEHRQQLVNNATRPGVKEGFDKLYGSGAAEFVLNRIKLQNAVPARR